MVVTVELEHAPVCHPFHAVPHRDDIIALSSP